LFAFTTTIAASFERTAEGGAVGQSFVFFTRGRAFLGGKRTAPGGGAVASLGKGRGVGVRGFGDIGLRGAVEAVAPLPRRRAARRKSGDNYYLANDANFVNRYYHRSDILLRSFFR
jgi:hypothetical protein